MLHRIHQASRQFTSSLVRYHSTKIAIVGSGPAGFYTTQKLLKNPDVSCDIYEKLPTPFGLVRYGVAPDHPDVKNVIKSFTSTASNDRVHFYGNVAFGQDISLDDLMATYNAVVLCYGSAQDKLLNIEGEQTTNTISAKNFVGWYNGLPEDKDLNPNLDCDTACIIGQGNVALDCARILLRPANLDKTDITSHAQKTLANSKIKRIYIVGRRGPLQVSFTIKELRELIKLHAGTTRLDPYTIFEDAKVSVKALTTLDRPRRRITELLLDLASRGSCETSTHNSELVFKFLSKPYRIVADDKTGCVSRLELQRTEYHSLDDFLNQQAKPADIDAYESIDCGLIIRSIGFKATMVDKRLPVDPKQGSVLNTNGRVQGYNGLYCSGWLATGAVGVIAGTLNSSQLTGQSILDDLQSGRLSKLEKPGFKVIQKILKQRKVQVVQFSDWERIDELERRLGEILGKPREKLLDVNKMLEVAAGQEQSKW